MARVKRFSVALTVFLCIICLLVGAVGGAYFAVQQSAASYHSDETSVIVDGEFQVHFLELGNAETGDCTYIKSGDIDILIDAGSKTSSVTTIAAYLNEHVTDGTLEYVIVTHAHRDHYAGFTVKDGSIFDLFECEVIIDFAQTNQTATPTTDYGKYLAERDAEIAAGAKHYTAAEAVAQNGGKFELAEGLTMTVLDSYYYYNKSSEENDYSVCTLFTYGEKHYLFTGDLEDKGEEELVKLNTLPEVALYKAGHHGSGTSSTAALLAVIKPEIVCVCCCCGSSQYTPVNDNQFPTQAFINRVAPYTDKVYVTTLCVDYSAKTFTSMNGNIAVITDKNGVRVECSNDNRVLKEWDWFKENRVSPSSWK